MFEISELKEKKLPELQELAKTLGVPKFKSLKKLDLVYQILDYQAANPKVAKAVVQEVKSTSEPAPTKTQNAPKEQEQEKKEAPAQQKPNKPQNNQRERRPTIEMITVTTIAIKKEVKSHIIPKTRKVQRIVTKTIHKIHQKAIEAQTGIKNTIKNKTIRTGIKILAIGIVNPILSLTES